MTIVEKIDDTIIALENKKLSDLLPILCSLALDFSDAEGFCFFSFWGKPVFKDSNQKMNFDDIERSLIEIGIAKGEDRRKMLQISFEKYMSSRTINKDQVCMYTAKELEDVCDRYEDMINNCDTPQNLHPVDLYFRSQENETLKSQLIIQLADIERQYALLRSQMAEKLNLYRIQAKNVERKQEINSAMITSKKVFIIHGHNEAKRLELEKMIKEFGLTPVILSEQPSQGMTIIEKFEHFASECGFAFALFTPDDIVGDKDGKQYFQARPNVIFELGWFYSYLGRSKVCILSQASEKNTIFSDLQGVMRIQFDNDISERFIEIKRELESAGMVK